eukprot:scaffold85309_cov63-Phaeocystis_antarctica.AAC.1
MDLEWQPLTLPLKLAPRFRPTVPNSMKWCRAAGAGGAEYGDPPCCYWRPPHRAGPGHQASACQRASS